MTNQTLEFPNTSLFLSRLPAYYPRVTYTPVQLSSVQLLHTRKDGMWSVRLDHPIHKDSGHWTVIHWPTLVHRMCETDPVISRVLRDLRVFPEELLASDFWRHFKLEFEGTELPRGSSNTQVVAPFATLTSHVNERECTVFRCADYTAPTRRLQVLAENAYLKRVGEINKDILIKTPKLFQLLVRVLQSTSLEVADPFYEYGLAWVKGGLYLHFGRALHTIRLTDPMFLQSDFHELIVSWGEDKDFGSIRVGTKALRLAPHIHKNKEIFMKEIACLKANYTDIDNFSTEFNEKFSCVFINLNEYISKLLDVSRLPELFNAMNYSAPRINKPRAMKISIVNLDAGELGYDPGTPDYDYGLKVPLTMYAMSTRDTVYLTVPQELLNFIPLLENAKYYHRRPGQHYVTMKNLEDDKFTKLPMQRLPIPGDRAAVIVYKDRTYFNPALLQPGGEVDTIMDVLIKRGRFNKELATYAKCYKRLLQWILNPKPLLTESDVTLTGELYDLVADDSGCPVHLNNQDERLEFLYNKGKHRHLSKLAYANRPGIDSSKTPPLTEHDKYIIWHVNTKELPRLPYDLNRRQRAEYTAKRWLPWQRPVRLAKFMLDTPKIAVKNARLSTTPEALEELLQVANATFGEALI